MKTNLSSLMNKIADDEKKFSELTYSIRDYVYTTTIQELDGKENIIDDSKEDFLKQFKKINELALEISKLKDILYSKNNEFKLSDGRTIQSAIADNTNARKLKETLEKLLEYKSYKKRVTEVNNSYFESREINYDSNVVSKQLEELEKQIMETDFEISKLNSIEFDI